MKELEAKELEIPAEMGNIEHEVEKLSEAIAKLRTRLDPVMREHDDPRNPDTENKVISSPMGLRLNDTTIRLRELNEVVNSILRKLEV